MKRSTALVACVATALLASTGGAVAAATITGAQIRNGTITGVDLKDSTVGSADIKNGTLTMGDLALSTRNALDDPAPAPPTRTVESSAGTLPGSTSSQAFSATCPAGTRVVSGGVVTEPASPAGNAIVRSTAPTADQSGWTAVVGTTTSVDVAVTVRALCEATT